MARPIFYPTRDQLVTDPYGSPVAGQTVRIYTAPTGGSQITDLLAVNPVTGATGSAIASGLLVSDGNGFIPAFASVDGGRDVVYADCGPYGSRTALVADPSSAGSGGGGGVTGTGGGAVTTTVQIAADAAFTGTYAASLTRTAVKTGAYTAAPNDLVPADSTGGAFTITLPTAPADRARVAVKHAIQGAANVVTVAAGGSDVFNRTGGATTAPLTLLAQGAVYEYNAAGAIWTITAADIPLSGLDIRHGPIVGSDAWLKLHAGGNLDALITGAITRDGNGAATAAGVIWPDGTTGAYAATTVSTPFPGAVDAYTVTYVGSTTKTVTQSAVTRDSASGAVTTRPAMTVA